MVVPPAFIPTPVVLGKAHWAWAALWLFGYYKPYILAHHYARFLLGYGRPHSFISSIKTYLPLLPGLLFYFLARFFTGISRVVWKYLILLTHDILNVQSAPRKIRQIALYSKIIDFIDSEVKEIATLEKTMIDNPF